MSVRLLWWFILCGCDNMHVLSRCVLSRSSVMGALLAVPPALEIKGATVFSPSHFSLALNISKNQTLLYPISLFFTPSVPVGSPLSTRQLNSQASVPPPPPATERQVLACRPNFQVVDSVVSENGGGCCGGLFAFLSHLFLRYVPLCFPIAAICPSGPFFSTDTKPWWMPPIAPFDPKFELISSKCFLSHHSILLSVKCGCPPLTAKPWHGP